MHTNINREVDDSELLSYLVTILMGVTSIWDVNLIMPFLQALQSSIIEFTLCRSKVYHHRVNGGKVRIHWKWEFVYKHSHSNTIHSFRSGVFQKWNKMKECVLGPTVMMKSESGSSLMKTPRSRIHIKKLQKVFHDLKQ